MPSNGNGKGKLNASIEAALMNSTDEDAVKLLETHRLECNSGGKYQEAEIAHLKIQEHCSAEHENRRGALKGRHLAEHMDTDQTHMKELDEFDITWDARANQFEAHAENLLIALEERNKGDHKAYLEKLVLETEPRAPHWSSELLRKRKVQTTLGQLKNYSEAHKIKVDADKLEAKEKAQWQAQRDKKIKSLESKFLEKQRMEMAGLVKRIESGREEQSQTRKNELNRILQRYINVKAQLESQQKIVLQRFEKYPVSAKDLAAKKNGKTMPTSAPVSALASAHDGYPAGRALGA